MIKRIFWDIDETLIHTTAGSDHPGQECKTYQLDFDGTTYHTICRPIAKELIEFSRALVGKDNVFILTTSVEEYAKNINAIFEFGFDEHQIIHRGDINAHTATFPGAYGASHSFYKQHPLADPQNVLIDNLPPRENESKTSMIGIKDRARYLHIRDYYGVNFTDDPFGDDVKEFLTLHHEA